ncbi:MAG TPA: hypothetical protein VMW17_22670 [Candidatus Binatia bacterium]|nr:hypothetical protein [Candidatus Binatia bacterium]
MTDTPISLERFTHLLDAYGANPARWPDDERALAQHLIEQSDIARAMWQQAAALDRVLDAVPSEPASPLLTAQVLATAPRRRRMRGWRVVMGTVPLAAAAAATLWFVADQRSTRPTAELTLVQIGEYASPTDALLATFAVDTSVTAPSIGCSDSALGCPILEAPAIDPYSQLPRQGRIYS